MTAGPVPAHDADPLAAALDHARRGAGRPPGWDDTLDAAYTARFKHGATPRRGAQGAAR